MKYKKHSTRREGIKMGKRKIVTVIIKAGDNVGKTTARVYRSLPCDLYDAAAELADELYRKGEVPEQWLKKAPGDWRDLNCPCDFLDFLNLKIEKIVANYFFFDFGYDDDSLELLNAVCECIDGMNELEAYRLAAVYDYECHDYMLTAGEMFDLIDRADGRDFFFDLDGEEAAREMVRKGRFGDIPDFIKLHIDYQSVADDLINSGEYCETAYGFISCH